MYLRYLMEVTPKTETIGRSSGQALVIDDLSQQSEYEATSKYNKGI